MDSQLGQRVALIKEWFAAYNARDLDGVVRRLDPDIELVPSAAFAPRGTSYHGPDGVRALLAQQFELFPELTVALGAIEEVGPALLAEVVASLGTSAGSKPLVVATVYEFEGPYVRRSRAFASEQDARAAIAPSPSLLTAREREVFGLLAQGLTAPEIADRLVLAPATVRTHVHNGVTRIGARTRVQAVAMALDRGEIAL
jgi:DNA-binding CsgD family transcriptional regulator/ketosteroid isomerase-like protein